MPETETELRQQRETVRQAMLRANTAVAVILAALVGLALAAVGAGVRAVRNQHRAEASEREQQAQLWQSYLEQARATRLGGLAGGRARALAAIGNAAEIQDSVELRNEAIACLSLMDLEVRTPPRGMVPGDVRCFDVTPSFGAYVRVFVTGLAEVVRFEDDRVLETFHPETAGLDADAIATWTQFSPDGTHLGVGFLDGTVLLWRRSDGVLAHHQLRPGLGSLTPPVFSPNGRWFAYRNSRLADGDGLSLFELKTGRVLDLPGVAPFHACAVASGKPWVALGNGRTVRLIDYETGTMLRTLEHPSDVARLAWSHDGRKLAAACARGDVLLWGFEPEHYQVLTGHSEFVTTLAFRSDDRFLISAGQDETTRLWDCEQGRQLLWTTEVEGLRWNADGVRIAFLHKGLGAGIWDLIQPSSVRTFAIGAAGNDPNRPFDLAPSGRWLVVLAPSGVQVWDLSLDGSSWFEPFPTITNWPRMASWTVNVHPAEDALLVCYAGRLELWPMRLDAEGRCEGFGARRPVALPPGAVPRQATLSLNGRTVLVELTDRRFVVVDLLEEHPPVPLDGRGRLFYWSQAGSGTGAGRFVVSPDGRWAALGKDVGPNSGPTVWDTASGKLVFNQDAGGFAAFSPDGEWFGASTANQYVWMRTCDWQTNLRLDQPTLAARAGSFAWPGDSRRWFASHSRQAVEFLDNESGSQLALFTLPGQQSAAGIRVSHDGRRLVISTPRSVLVTWDLDGLRQELAQWRLDWPEPGGMRGGPERLVGRQGSTGWFSPVQLVVVGLLLVAAAAVFAGVMLRRHRSLTLQFVKSESLARQRHRELETARDELMHSEKMKALGTLAAGIAHDFNNLLSVIRMSGKLVSRATPDQPEVQEHVEDIEQAVQQGKAVVGSMLGYARESGEDSIAQDLDTVVEETVSLLSREFLSGIQLTLELDRFLPPVAVIRGRLEQMLLNIIVNAAEAMKGHGRITIATRQCVAPGAASWVLRPRPAAAYIELTVSDSGPGMAPEVIGHVFEPFFTTKTDAVRKGTGLGLSMVYTIAEQEGFGLALVSTPGQGAHFTVLVPARPATETVLQTHIVDADQRS